MGSGCNVVCNPSPIRLQLQFPDCLLLLELLPLSQYSIALIRPILAACGIYQVSVIACSDSTFCSEFKMHLVLLGAHSQLGVKSHESDSLPQNEKDAGSALED